MARRKDSVALFEVITAAKRREQSSSAAGDGASRPSILRTPKWWFKSKSARQQSSHADSTYAAPPPAALPPAHAPAQLAAPPEALSATLPQVGAGVVQRVAPSGYAAGPERVTIPHQSHEADPFGLDVPAETAPAPARRSWLGLIPRKLRIDPDRREVTLRVRYTTAIIVGFALCIAVGLAYVTGRQSSNRASARPNGVSSEEIRKGPVLPGVLGIGPERQSTGADESFSLPEPSRDTGAKETSRSRTPLERPTGAQSQKQPVAPPLPRPAPGGVERGLPRMNGLNYVIVQSYPEKSVAEAAQQALAAAGIHCTVERPPKSWSGNSNLWCVIGLDGFPRTESMPEYRQYRQSIEAVSKTFAGKSKYRQFEPSPIKWKDS